MWFSEQHLGLEPMIYCTLTITPPMWLLLKGLQPKLFKGFPPCVSIEHKISFSKDFFLKEINKRCLQNVHIFHQQSLVSYSYPRPPVYPLYAAYCRQIHMDLMDCWRSLLPYLHPSTILDGQDLPPKTFLAIKSLISN